MLLMTMNLLLVKKIISESILKSIKSCKYDTNIDEKDIKLNELYKLLNNSGIKFNGVDGKFYFKLNLQLRY